MLRIGGRRPYMLALLLAIYTCHFMDRQIVAILKPAIQRDLGLSDTQLGLLSGLAFTLFYATLGIPLGLLADRGPRVRLVTAALLVFSGMTALGALARGFGHLVLARIGVGVGEAGTSPASHAIIADLYPPAERGRAMAIFALGPHLGLVLSFLVGGVVSARYGWRAAFVAAGVPGLVLAGVTWLTLTEPARTAVPAGGGLAPATAARELVTRPVLRHLVAGAGLAAAIALGVLGWLPAFLARTHGLGPGPSGIALALIIGVGGGVGTWLGGWLTDRLRRRDRRWVLWIPALALAGSAPLWLAVCAAGTPGLALAFLLVPGGLLGVFLAPSFALLQELVDPRNRALGASLLLLVTNLVGGLGPVALGLLSDVLAPAAGRDALRWALVAVAPLGCWAAGHYVAAARALARGATRGEALAPPRPATGRPPAGGVTVAPARPGARR